MKIIGITPGSSVEVAEGCEGMNCDTSPSCDCYDSGGCDSGDGNG